VVNGCGEPRLADKPSAVVGVGVRDWEKLQRDHPSERDLFGAIDAAHSAASQKLFYPEPTQLSSGQRIRKHPTTPRQEADQASER